MDIFLFGATGGTGKEVLLKLLEENHQVKVLARNPAVLDDLQNTYSNLKIIQGNLYNSESYKDELSRCSVVISALGTGTSRNPTEVYSKGGKCIISAMREAKVKRLITITAAAFDSTDPGTKNFIVQYIVQPLFKNIYSDMQQWESILEDCNDIAWTCIRPSRLTNGPQKSNYRVQLNHCPKGGGKISRKDLADFIMKQINSDNFIHQKVAIAY